MFAKSQMIVLASALLFCSPLVGGLFAREKPPRKPPRFDAPKDTRRLSLIDDLPVDRKKPEPNARFVIHGTGDRIILLDSATGDSWLFAPSKGWLAAQWKPIVRTPVPEESVDPFGDRKLVRELIKENSKDLVRDLVKEIRKQIEMLIHALGLDE